MTKLLDGPVFVTTHQYYMQSGDVLPAWDEAFRQQSNGILGGALPGLLTIASGVHTGYIDICVMLVDAPPPVAQHWEDVVEVSFRPLTEGLTVADGETDELHDFSLPIDDYRARLSVRGMDEGEALITLDMPSDTIVEHHELMFWRAILGSDSVLRQGSRCAAGQHRWVQTLP